MLPGSIPGSATNLRGKQMQMRGFKATRENGDTRIIPTKHHKLDDHGCVRRAAPKNPFGTKKQRSKWKREVKRIVAANQA